MLTQAELKEILHYNPETGVFTRLKTVSSNGVIGSIAGFYVKGYRAIKIARKSYYVHRLAFLYMTGEFPENEVDHINRLRDDNRWCNLRDATRWQNARNLPFRVDNTSGFTGVVRAGKRWESKVRVFGVDTHLGTFDTPEEAHAAYIAAKPGFHDS